MPKKAVTKPNGFFVFATDYKKKNSKNGKAMSMIAATEAAGQIWSRMGPSERAPYIKRANVEKSNNLIKKFTSQGVPITVVEKEEEEKKQFEFKMLEDVKRSVHLAKNEDFATNFYIVHVNTFCYVSNENRYYPAEIAVCRFSLQKGVLEKGVYHAICHPGNLPQGYTSTAIDISKSTHQMVVPSRLDRNVNNNLISIFENIIDFLKPDTKYGSSYLPPLYAIPSNLHAATNVLEDMSSNYDMPDGAMKVYNLAALFFHLRNAVVDKMVFPSIAYATTEIERDIYEYTKRISCQYHEEGAITTHCSKSIVIRMAFMICDNCCICLNIPLIPGCHVPLKSKNFQKIPMGSSIARSVVSKSSATFEMSSLSCDDDDRMSFMSMTDLDSMSCKSTDNSSRVSSCLNRLRLRHDSDREIEEPEKHEFTFKSQSTQSEEPDCRRRRFANADSENEESDMSLVMGLSQDSEGDTSSVSGVSVATGKGQWRHHTIYSDKW